MEKLIHLIGKLPEPLMIKPNIFISYKRNHAPTAELVDHLESMLSGAGYNVWRDVNIEPGARGQLSFTLGLWSVRQPSRLSATRCLRIGMVPTGMVVPS